MKLVIRSAIAIAAIASVTAGGAAVAAPKLACNNLSDAAGDAKGLVITDPAPMPTSAKNLDVISADLGSNAKTLTAVVRLTALDATDVESPGGRTYYFYFTAKDVEFYLTASKAAAGAETYSVGFVDPTLGRSRLAGATGVFDTAKKEVRISAPLAAFAAQAKLTPGSSVTDLNLLTQRVAGVFTLTADEAVGDKPYVLGKANCVKVGK